MQVKKVHGLPEELHYGNDRLVSSVSKYNLMREIEICKWQPNYPMSPHFLLILLVLMRIWIKRFRSRIQFRMQGFDDKNFKILQLKIFFMMGFHEGRPCNRRSLQISKKYHPALQNIKSALFFIFVNNFCPPGSGSS